MKMMMQEKENRAVISFLLTEIFYNDSYLYLSKSPFVPCYIKDYCSENLGTRVLIIRIILNDAISSKWYIS